MKKYILLALAPLFMGCSKDDLNYKNPYLPTTYGFSLDVDMTLPLYSPLQYTGNPVRVTTQGYGINGVIIMNTGGGFTAFEASCPNQELSSCSEMTLNGIKAVCPCDDVEYSLFTGQPDADSGLKYSMMPYRIEIISATHIRVYN